MYTLLPVLIDYELQQKQEEGCDISAIRQEFHAWLKRKGCSIREVFYAIRDQELQYEEEDDQTLLPLYDRLLSLTNEEEARRHPAALDAILAVADLQQTEGIRQAALEKDHLYERIYGGWLGRAAGCTLGKPVELWPHDRVISYLQLARAYPLNDYIPGLNPMPEGYRFKDEYHGAIKGEVNGAPRDDDMDYAILNLQVLDRCGEGFTTADIGQEWLRHMPYKLVYTAERVTYKNLINGVLPPESATYRNPYREWIGAQIRADLWGWVNPGNPLGAVTMAYRDATLSHTGNGVYGALWIAAMIASAFVCEDVEAIIRHGLAFVPKDSRFAAAIRQVIDWYHRYPDWRDCLQRIHEQYGTYHTVHTLNNAAVVAMSLLYSGGDFEKGITIAVMAGWDTDCNGASVGSVLGVRNGAAQLPPKWTAPLQDTISTLIVSDRRVTLSSLARRTTEHAIQILERRECRA
ncbi:ADP-ribosylglycohydrolase family protein [Brevibacillus sp. SYP-B805]|uniref:ADP-ribosylglycohydrolase family protein n=1 Tax=Brevibacillus sp. SYP-B805 TaxID=1578199 RepID=UPI0013E9F803|nr:ADP-ribosylglycohydrolase family protein [Brevibacillus sp. SYP-B805]NGQ95858.1 ADP-ribosylglycohydrolase family protein [Brevibacillus sp. SYP-B805]